MEVVKNTNKQLWITAGIITGIILFGFIIQPKLTQNTNDQTISNLLPTPSRAIPKIVSYKGKNGKDALSLLKAHHQIRQDDSDMVVSIDDRSAESKNHEYWAFYVNQELATVGPQSYKTQDSDLIEWKIEKY